MSGRAVLYARVSGDDTRREGRNLQSQIDDGRAYCQEKGYCIMAELAEDDRGASGASWDLPMLNQALDMARENGFDVLVTRELDRLARGLAKQLVVEGEFKRHGVEIEYILAEYDDTPEGRLNKHIRGVIAEFEREKINQRMTRGRRNIVKAGKVMLHGNKPPYGYRVEDRELVIHEPEAKIVRLIYTWYTIGDEADQKLTISGIATKLTGMQVPTWSDTHGTPFKRKRGYAEWSESGVSKILENETYCGVWHYGKRGRTHTNPRDNWLALDVPDIAIVSREVWEAAQERRAYNKKMSRRRTKADYLVRGRVVCGLCTTPMIGRMEKGKYHYYYCPRGTGRHVGASCENNRYFKVGQVDEAVWWGVKDMLHDPDHLRRKLEEQRDKLRQDLQPLFERVQVIDDLLVEKRQQLERALDLYLSGKFDEEMLIERKTRLEATINSLETERQVMTYAGRERMLTDEQIKTVVDVARKLTGELKAADVDFEARRRMIDTLDCQAILSIEDGQQTGLIRCSIGERPLSLDPADIRTGKDSDQCLVTLIARLQLDHLAGDPEPGPGFSVAILPSAGDDLAKQNFCAIL